MSKIGTLILAFALSLPLAAASPDAGPAVMPFTVTRSLMIVTVTVNGQPKRMIFDTGAERTILNDHANVERTARLTVGNSLLVNFPLIMADMSGTDVSKAGADGVLGQDVLRKFQSVRIDYKNQTVELSK